MLLKKTYFVSAYSGLQQIQCCTGSPQLACGSSTSPSAQHTRPTPRQHHTPYSTNAFPDRSRTKRRRVTGPLWLTSRRSYATVKDGSGVDFRDNMNWPCRKTSNAFNPFIPSPYEIFDMQRRDAYTKRRYYELVKIYHPDRPSHLSGCESLTHVERLERYRLIVLAHEILSDPTKRRAYDAYGAGWGERRTATRYTRGYSSSASGKEYGQGAGYDNSPFSNATWEDWERWYRRSATSEQHQAYAGTYINPNAFAAFVILLAVLSGVLQATRATTLSGSMGEKQLAFTEETSRFMSERVSQLDGNKLGSEGRVKQFLERRDPTRYGLKEEEEKQYRKHFGDREDLAPLGRARLGRGEQEQEQEQEQQQQQEQQQEQQQGQQQGQGHE